MNAINGGIYSALAAGTALTALLGGPYIYHLQAPDSLGTITPHPLPYVVYSWMGGGRTTEVPNVIDQSEFIRAYGTSAANAGTINDAIITLLDNVAFTVPGWTTCLCMLEDDFESVETTPSGEQIYAMGGIYRVVIDK